MRKLNVGVLGAGRGMTFVKQFHDLPEAEMVALCDAYPQVLEKGIASAGIAGLQGFTSYEEMLKLDLDIVVVASAVPDHPRHARMALEGGKHVLSEVSAGMDMASCRELVQTVRRTGLKYMMGENSCYRGYLRVWKRLVAEGRLGDVHYAEGDYFHDLRNSFHVDPETGSRVPLRDLAKFPNAVKTWRATFHPILYLTHDLGPLLEVLDDRCVSVSCMSTPSAIGPDYAPAAEIAMFRTAKDRVIKIVVDWGLPHPCLHFLMLMGTNGSVENTRDYLPDSVQKNLLYVDDQNMSGFSRMSWAIPVLEGPTEARTSEHGGADWWISREFVDAIVNDTTPRIDIYRAMDFTVPGICAVESAEKGGASVEIPDLRAE